jgi:hypothetical protein
MEWLTAGPVKGSGTTDGPDAGSSVPVLDVQAHSYKPTATIALAEPVSGAENTSMGPLGGRWPFPGEPTARVAVSRWEGRGHRSAIFLSVTEIHVSKMRNAWAHARVDDRPAAGAAGWGGSARRGATIRAGNLETLLSRDFGVLKKVLLYIGSCTDPLEMMVCFAGAPLREQTPSGRSRRPSKTSAARPHCSTPTMIAMRTLLN